MLMPSHSPELQPAERLLLLTKEPIANKSFKTLNDLAQVLFEGANVVQATVSVSWTHQLSAVGASSCLSV
ncbi:MAG TPA: hypothetical protein V6D43_01140 [Candidatus Sericytochromatia bacterium]